jgi:ubiquinone/menaquinone biosynthesis C-methylase UbiE
MTYNKNSWSSPTEGYHLKRENTIRLEFEKYVLPRFLKFIGNRKEISIADLACGAGGMAGELLTYCNSNNIKIKRFLLIDVSESNLEFSKNRLHHIDDSLEIETYFSSGNGFDQYTSESVDFLYCWDAMVHFDILDVVGYLKTLKKVVNNQAFFHHSNYNVLTNNISNNPHMRNFMTKEVFHQICISLGYSVLNQEVISWIKSKDHDCLTVVGI